MAGKIGIKDLVKKTPDELLEIFGFKDKVAKAQEEIQKMDKLEGKARTIAEERIERMFEPHVYPDEFQYIRESAEREAKRKQTGKEALCDCSPCSVLD
jgi:hypothetical protein